MLVSQFLCASRKMLPVKEICKIPFFLTAILFLCGVQDGESHLVFEPFTSCTYEYELAVHAARGSHSTASSGMQLSALVS